MGEKLTSLFSFYSVCKVGCEAKLSWEVVISCYVGSKLELRGLKTESRWKTSSGSTLGLKVAWKR